MEIVQQFFTTGVIDDQLRHTNIALIPKKRNPNFMTDLRPISLCNIVYKIISKVLANRLKQIIDSIISDTQSVFIPGRQITDNIMVAFEVMHYMKRKDKGKESWMVLKLDMSKAYDRVEWRFLEAALQKLGFDRRVIKLFMSCISSVSYQIFHAGRSVGPIVPARGLRQGDPLSFYLFLICTEGLTALLHVYEQQKKLTGIKVARSPPYFSYVLRRRFLYFLQSQCRQCRSSITCA